MRFGRSPRAGGAGRLLVDTPGRKRVARYELPPHLCQMDTPAAMPRADRTARLPADSHIGRVRLRVGDLERSLRFFRDLLGFRVTGEEASRISLALGPDERGGNDGIYPASELIVLEEKPGVRRRPSRPATTGLYHVALLVPTRAELGRALLGLSEARYPLRGMSDHAVAFYRDVIGFDPMMRIHSLAAVSAGGYHHHINLNTWAGEGAAPDSDS